MTKPSPSGQRPLLALALDVDDLIAATRLARSLNPYFGVAKVGLELFSAAGPEIIAVLNNYDMDVFLDLKLHDIPNTVEKASRVIGSFGVKYLTMHAQGGEDMLRAGVEGLAYGASAAGMEVPASVAVTVLTSDGQAPEHVLPRRLRTAVEAGCTGVVCATDDLEHVRALTPRLTTVVPGIRPAGVPHDDQARVATPQEALDAGADLLVIGRAVTQQSDPVKAAENLFVNE